MDVDAIRALAAEGMTATQIAARVGRSASAVRSAAARAGITLAKGKRGNPRSRPLPPEQIAHAAEVRAGLEAGESYAVIGLRLGISRQRVGAIAARLRP